MVLDVLPQISVGQDNKDLWNSVKGMALFQRAFSLFQLSQLYCRPYSVSATSDLGLPLPLTPFTQSNYVRSTVEQTYQQIIEDLMVCTERLPKSVVIQSRPNKAAAFALLARVHLSKRDYDSAGKYANLCLQEKNDLLDYNTLDALATVPISPFNAEEIYYNNAGSRPSFPPYSKG